MWIICVAIISTSEHVYGKLFVSKNELKVQIIFEGKNVKI